MITMIIIITIIISVSYSGVLGSNTDTSTGYPEVCCGFLHFLQTNGIMLQTGP
jgi:hypothetical protein